MKNRRQQAGFAMLLVFAMAAAVAILLYREAPRMMFQSQREREQLLIDRGEEFKRGIQLYVRQLKKYPASMEDLEKTNEVRFLRRRYRDPLTGKDEWRLIHIDAAGVFTDSLVHAKEKEEEQTAGQSFVGTIPFVGQTPQTGAPGAGPGGGAAGVALGNRASDRPAVAAGYRPPEGQFPPNYDPNNPGAGQPHGDDNQNPDGSQQGQPQYPGQPSAPGQQTSESGQNPQFPGQPLYPGQQPDPNQPGQQPGGWPGTVPGQVQPGQPIYPGQTQPGQQQVQQQFPGQQQPGQVPVPGVPGMVQPGQYPRFPGQQQVPGQQPFPGQQQQFPGQQQQFPGQQQQQQTQQQASRPVVGGYFDYGSQQQQQQAQSTRFPNQPGAQQGAYAQPGAFGQPANQPPAGMNFPGSRPPPSPPGMAAQQPAGAGARQAGGAAPTQAADLIRQILTNPRPGGAPPGVGAAGAGGQTIAGGIAGVATTIEDDTEGIKVYNERSKYKEWEFIYDMREDKSLTALGGQQQGGQQPGSQQPGDQGGTGGRPGGAGQTPFGMSGPGAAPGATPAPRR